LGNLHVIPGIRDASLHEIKRFLRREDFDSHLTMHRLLFLDHPEDDFHPIVAGMKEKYAPLDLWPLRLLNGNDLITMGYTPDKRFKDVLTRLEDAQLDGVVSNLSEATEFVRNYYEWIGEQNGTAIRNATK